MSTPALYRPVDAPFRQLGVALIPQHREWWRGGILDALALRKRHRSTHRTPQH
ncbi:hypothetical protein [Microbacterium dauci]|uniref:Uncharacterized protein n=1 Tax=Microbacterium dauci TaxID=3048008 RepID=A0ABT6ZEJ0_9MICO|nr:hypothetical protein [Microbacterium sp. LX3-4]MDJ1114578.1 hypothetical protein [Microbacterium sp. LX3-4]